MKVQKKTNPNYLRRKDEYLKEKTRRFKIQIFKIQENVKEDQLNMLLRQNEKECRKIRKEVSNLLIETNIQRNRNRT